MIKQILRFDETDRNSTSLLIDEISSSINGLNLIKYTCLILAISARGSLEVGY